MDLKDFTTSLTLTTANEPDEMGEVMDDLERFQKDFAHLVMVCQVNSLSEADQDSVKSTFIGKWFGFIQRMNQLKLNMVLDTTKAVTIGSIDGWANAQTTSTMQLKAVGWRAGSAWSTPLFFATGFTQTNLDTLIPSPGAYTAYLVFYDAQGTSGNQYLIIKMSENILSVDDAISEVDEADLTYDIGLSVISGLYTLLFTSQNVDVEIDLLATYFPMADERISGYDEVITDRKSVV